jgi:glutathione reductase (NADPH)
MATVGVTEDEARDEHGDDIEIYKSKFTPMKLTMFKPLDVQPKTMMKLVVQKSTDKVLGVHMCGPDAAEIIQVCEAMRLDETNTRYSMHAVRIHTVLTHGAHACDTHPLMHYNRAWLLR